MTALALAPEEVVVTKYRWVIGGGGIDEMEAATSAPDGLLRIRVEAHPRVVSFLLPVSGGRWGDFSQADAERFTGLSAEELEWCVDETERRNRDLLDEPRLEDAGDWRDAR